MHDVIYMRRALSLARRARGRTSPNPMVGAVVVKRGRIISEGYHKKAGTPHAEVIALDAAGDRAEGATLYVTLEPCCHKDKRTPPCTERIIRSKIDRVVVAMSDPNPKVSGRGLEELRTAGITVVSGVLDKKARDLNEFYIKHITKRSPFVILKVAMTLDGKIATPSGESKWITGEAARREVHRLRGSVDAVLTAIGTVKADDPQLTCRTGRRKDPTRVILDPECEISPDARVLSCPPPTVIVTRTGASFRRKKSLKEKGALFIEHEPERVDLNRLMEKLYMMGITSVLIEGGASLNSSCLEAGIVDKVMFFIAPKIIGGKDSFPAVGGKVFRSLNNAVLLRRTRVRRLGDDFLFEGYLT
ncbi:MAG: bifunctional diaminohydroxyphosphoribosylaminopyrimidine deaminase/5-amino-6-(5-phosphoribosylamino)uracil reductase RibD [Nitrospirae bacterium]|nr:bifunctional diaminohydroxyphosphoribosylaminopyrimidine deaminase/5-amino-6-(5-phosphoribosylamino)uracil reductase RibD [Nitrospirota bacterium]